MTKNIDNRSTGHHPPMPSLQIRELPPDVYEALSYRAERNGRSLAQQAIVELRRAQDVDRRDGRQRILEQIRGRIERDGIRDIGPVPEELIREDRRR
jgi:plasmid stability protein